MFEILINKIIKELESLSIHNVEEVEKKVQNLFNMIKKKKSQKNTEFLEVEESSTYNKEFQIEQSVLDEYAKNGAYPLIRFKVGGSLGDFYIPEKFIRELNATHGCIIKVRKKERHPSLQVKTNQLLDYNYFLAERRFVDNGYCNFDLGVVKKSKFNKDLFIINSDIFGNPLFINGELATFKFSESHVKKFKVQLNDVMSIGWFEKKFDDALPQWKYKTFKNNPFENILAIKKMVLQGNYPYGLPKSYQIPESFQLRCNSSNKKDDNLKELSTVSKKPYTIKSNIPKSLKDKTILILGGTNRYQDFKSLIEERGGTIEIAHGPEKKIIITNMVKRADLIIVITTEVSHSLSLHAKAKAKDNDKLFVHYNEIGKSNFIKLVYDSLNINSTI